MSTISRCSFVGASALAAAAMVAGCAPENALDATDEGQSLSATGQGYTVDAEFDEAQAGEWVPVSCWTSCGGRCLPKAYVVDGMPMRIKTDDIEEDSFDNFQNRACPRGRAQRMHAFSADRIKYPMKRKSWQPGGGEAAHGELRGKDEWERISWDEALDLCATEVKRIADTYGPMAINYAGIPFYNAPVAQTLLPALGGYTWHLGFTSYGSWCSEPDAIGIDNTAGEPGTMGTNDRLSMLESDLIVLHGNNPVHAAAGSPPLHLMRAHEAGIPFIFIGPDYSQTAALVEARWIPVRPTTDAAFLSAVIYEMLRLDEERGSVIDWDFLYSHTVGFDDDHMPADAKLAENVRGYVEGAYDAIIAVRRAYPRVVFHLHAGSSLTLLDRLNAGPARFHARSRAYCAPRLRGLGLPRGGCLARLSSARHAACGKDLRSSRGFSGGAPHCVAPVSQEWFSEAMGRRVLCQHQACGFHGYLSQPLASVSGGPRGPYAGIPLFPERRGFRLGFPRHSLRSSLGDGQRAHLEEGAPPVAGVAGVP